MFIIHLIFKLKKNKPKTLILFLILINTFIGCQHLRSGQYIQIRSGDTIEKLAKRFNVSPASILNENRGKSFRVGNWYFIPLKRGVMNRIYRSKIRYADADYHQNNFFNAKYLWPVPSSLKVSSNFGTRNGRPHKGIDIPARTGSSIVAVEDGIVVHSGNKVSGYGNMTIVAHETGLFTVYAHARRNLTHKGQKVYRGQIIAEVGSTGRATGPHLHFEIRKGPRAIPPMSFFLK